MPDLCTNSFGKYTPTWRVQPVTSADAMTECGKVDLGDPVGKEYKSTAIPTVPISTALLQDYVNCHDVKTGCSRAGPTGHEQGRY